MSKEIKARVQQKHGTKAEWDRATSFVPLKGELIVYTDLNKIKIGDGITKVSNLKFSQALDETAVHITGNETVAGNKTFSGANIFKSGMDISSAGNAILNIEGISTNVDYIDLYVTGSNNSSRPLVLQNNESGKGNVGVGIATPSEKVEVNGNVKATKFIGQFSADSLIDYTEYTDTEVENLYNAG